MIIDYNGKVMPVLDDQDWIAMKVENIRKARQGHTRVLSRPKAGVERRQILPLPFSGEQFKVQKDRQ